MKTFSLTAALLLTAVIFLNGFTFLSYPVSKSISQFSTPKTDTIIYQKWILKKINGKDVTKEDAGKKIPFLKFNLLESKLSGSTGCNSIYGKAEITDNEITFSGVSTTKMECHDAKYEMDVEQIIFCKQPLKYKIENNILTIFKDGTEFMILEPPASNPIYNKWILKRPFKNLLMTTTTLQIYNKWILKRLNSVEVPAEITQTETPYLEFLMQDSLIQGSSGCNHKNGKANITETELTFYYMSTTKRGCDNMRFEMDFDQIVFYKESLKYKIENNTLTLFKNDSEVMYLEKAQ